MAEIGEPGLPAPALAIEPGPGIGRREMRGVRSLLAVEVDLGIAVMIGGLGRIGRLR